MMRKHRADRLHALCGKRSDQLANRGAELHHHFEARNGKADDSGLLGVGCG